LTTNLLASVLCPRCAVAIDVRAPAIKCARATRTTPASGKYAVLLPRPDAPRRDVAPATGLLTVVAGQTQQGLEAAPPRPAGILPTGRARLRAMAAPSPASG